MILAFAGRHSGAAHVAPPSLPLSAGRPFDKLRTGYSLATCGNHHAGKPGYLAETTTPLTGNPLQAYD